MSPWKVLVFTAPITAILVLVALEQRQEVGVRLERAEIQSRIGEDKFDREFSAFFASGVAPNASAEADRSARLQRLESERDDLDARLRENLQRLDADAKDLRGALDQLDQTPSTQPRR